MDDLLLYKFLQNEASEDEIRTVLDWLDADPANRKYFDGLDNMLNAARVNRPAGRKPQRRPLPTLRSIGAWSMRIAAVLCLCLGVSYFAATKMFDRKASNNSLSVFVPNGERISMTLTDGTTVWLNSGAKLEYPSIFSRKTRRVKISGEAMFEVKHDASRPFIVETFACDAEVLGTKFNILADARTADFSAALLEGRLKILNRLGGGESFILSPNEQIDLVDGHLKLNRITDPDDFRWVDGLMNLNTLSFGEVIRKFENYYGVRITIDNPEDMPVLKYHGKIRVSDGVDHALKLLQITNNFSFTRDDETNTIHIKITKI